MSPVAIDDDHGDETELQAELKVPNANERLSPAEFLPRLILFRDGDPEVRNGAPESGIFRMIAALKAKIKRESEAPNGPKEEFDLTFAIHHFEGPNTTARRNASKGDKNAFTLDCYTRTAKDQEAPFPLSARLTIPLPKDLNYRHFSSKDFLLDLERFRQEISRMIDALEGKEKGVSPDNLRLTIEINYKPHKSAIVEDAPAAADGSEVFALSCYCNGP